MVYDEISIVIDSNSKIDRVSRNIDDDELLVLKDIEYDKYNISNVHCAYCLFLLLVSF